MSTTHPCPDWCTAGTDEHPCDGSHTRLDWETARVASGSYFPVVDERGAVFPAVNAGLNSSPSEGRGPNIFLFLRGPGHGDGEEIAFPLDEAFGLAVDILDMFRVAVQEIDRPIAPWRDWAALAPIVETIEHNLNWRLRERAADEPQRERTVQMTFTATDTECDAAMKAVERAILPLAQPNVSISSAPSRGTSADV